MCSGKNNLGRQRQPLWSHYNQVFCNGVREKEGPFSPADMSLVYTLAPTIHGSNRTTFLRAVHLSELLFPRVDRLECISFQSWAVDHLCLWKEFCWYYASKSDVGFISDARVYADSNVASLKETGIYKENKQLTVRSAYFGHSLFVSFYLVYYFKESRKTIHHSCFFQEHYILSTLFHMAAIYGHVNLVVKQEKYIWNMPFRHSLWPLKLKKPLMKA